jgi:mono/diheme cytochrome c family protein
MLGSMTPTSQAGRASHPVLWTLAAIVAIAIGVGAYFALGPRATDFAGGKKVPLAAYHEADPTGVPTELKSASLVERGEYLTRAADCLVCHTAEGGASFAGGRAFVLPFGTLYSTNITPDPETGIGQYSDADFLNALRKGIGRGNIELYPAMPYPSYTYMSDADALAIKAYLFSLKPARAPAPANSLAFPFNQRSLMALWSLFFNPDTRYEPNTERSAEWNRGAYVVEALEHCGECHTPRNLVYALNQRRKFAGATQAGWRAYNITPDPTTGIGAWSDEDIMHYLSLGHADGRGTASGPMGEAVDESISHLEPADIRAMVTYLRSTSAVGTSDLPRPKEAPAPPSHAEGLTANVDPLGKAVYEGACASCHGWTGVSPVGAVATLIGTRSVNDPSANNVAQVIIRGAHRRTNSALAMPAFGGAYSDMEIASVANYVIARFGAQPAEVTAERIAKLRLED